MSAWDPALTRLVDSVVGESPDIATTVEGLAPAHRREVDHLVRRDRLTPEAALAVIRGRRQMQRDALAHRALADEIAEGIIR